MSSTDVALVWSSCISAGGTLVLAGVTARMAWSTRKAAEATTSAAEATSNAAVQAGRSAEAAEKDLKQGQELLSVSQKQVEQAQRQADTATAALAESSKPLIVSALGTEAIPEGKINLEGVDGKSGLRFSGLIDPPRTTKSWNDNPSMLAWMVVRLRNIGTGPAVIGRELDDITLDLRAGGIINGWANSLVVAPGECVYVTFVDERSVAGGYHDCLWAHVNSARTTATTLLTPLTVSVNYRDITGTRLQCSGLTYLLNDSGGSQERAFQLESKA